MTIPLPPYTAPVRVNRIVPFTMQDGETYLSELERIKAYTIELAESVTAVVGESDAKFEAEVDRLILEVNASIEAGDERVTQRLGELVTLVNERIDEANAEVDDKLAEVDALAQAWMSTQITNNDAINAGILADPLSMTNRSIADLLYASIGAAADTVTNHARNPSMSNADISMYTATAGTLTRIAREPGMTFTDAANVALVTSDGTSTGIVFGHAGTNNTIAVVPGAAVGVVVRVGVDADMQASPRIIWRNSAGSIITPSAIAPYKPLLMDGAGVASVSGIAPAGAASFQVAVYGNMVAGGIVPAGKRLAVTRLRYFIGADLPTVSTLMSQPYRDGSFPGWEWIGTPELSASRALSITPRTTYASRDIYVSPTGNDSNVFGTSSAPFKTLARAVAAIPDLIRAGHTITLKIGAGDYNESLVIENKDVKGYLIVEGTGATRLDVKLNQFIARAIAGHFTVKNVAVKARATGQQFMFVTCPMAFAENCEGIGDPALGPIEGSGRIVFLADYGTNLMVSGSKGMHMRYFVRANYLSRAFVRDNDPGLDGSGNPTLYFGVAARHGGFAQIVGTRPAGVVTDLSTDLASVVVSGYGIMSKMGYDERAIVEAYQTTNAPSTYKRFEFRQRDIPAIPNFTAITKARLIFDSPTSLEPVQLDVIFDAQVDDGANERRLFVHRRFLLNYTDAGSVAVVSASNRDSVVPAGYAPTVDSVIDVANLLVGGNPGRRFRIDLFPQVLTKLNRWGITVEVKRVGLGEAPAVVSWDKL